MRSCKFGLFSLVVVGLFFSASTFAAGPLYMLRIDNVFISNQEISHIHFNAGGNDF